tara:strand:+ start:416 stop:727 length:312 start_codon:yes stop_codon:yes gene_type:complete
LNAAFDGGKKSLPGVLPGGLLGCLKVMNRQDGHCRQNVASKSGTSRRTQGICHPIALRISQRGVEQKRLDIQLFRSANGYSIKNAGHDDAAGADFPMARCNYR